MSDFRSLTLYLIRHGECQHNLKGRVAGQSDSPLTARGRLQACRAGELLVEVEPKLPDFQFYASPLHRAATTMEIAREAAGLPLYDYISDRRLSELDCGANTFRQWHEIETEMKADPAFADRWNWPHPGGESLLDLHCRVGDFLASLEKNAVIVSHAGTVRMIRAHYLQLPTDAVLAFQPLHATIIRLTAGTETDWRN
ncbi:MAG: histidine phosphatase family protein [Alphaproteobacteria bacterium]|nr:histidine phosphatase family protein [Alphaproteobacteria bacterium]